MLSDTMFRLLISEEALKSFSPKYVAPVHF